MIKSLIRKALTSTLDQLGYDFEIAKRPQKALAFLDKNNWIPFHGSDEKMALYYESQERTDMADSNTVIREFRYHTLIQILQHTLQKDIPGDFAECGCWKGLSAYITCKLIAEKSKSPRQFHIFDSFEGGLSDKHEEDMSSFAQQGDQAVSVEKTYFASTEDQLKAALRGYDFYTLNKGWIPERFPEYEDTRFAFVNIDVDLYHPTKDSFEFLFPRLSSGGILYCDDYNASHFPGAKQAIDECVEAFRDDIEFFYEVPMNSVFLIKK